VCSCAAQVLYQLGGLTLQCFAAPFICWHCGFSQDKLVGCGQLCAALCDIVVFSVWCWAGLGWAAPFTAVHFVAHWLLLHVCVGGWFTVVSGYKVLVGYLLL
jgi:hypothetical protein